jgi:UPF0755 protein
MLKKILLIVGGVVILAAIILPLYFYHALGKSVGTSDEKVIFEIEQGETTSQIIDRLDEKKLITSKLTALVYIRLKKITLKSGEFDLAENYSLKTVIDTLSGGEIKSYRVTIPEGWRLEQIAQRLEGRGIVKASDFMTAAKDMEGYLFPDTYVFKPRVTAAEIVETMHDNFLARTEGMNLTADDVKLASIIEREAENDADRPGISGVFKNRLKIDMVLQSDVTVVYQKDNNNYPKAGILNYKFWQQLASGDTTRIKGEYSTYQNKGLTPAPICNPGLPSLQAAQNPTSHNYYYFLYGKDSKIRYASTQAEQDQNANKYLY